MGDLTRLPGWQAPVVDLTMAVAAIRTDAAALRETADRMDELADTLAGEA